MGWKVIFQRKWSFFLSNICRISSLFNIYFSKELEDQENDDIGSL